MRPREFVRTHPASALKTGNVDAKSKEEALLLALAALASIDAGLKEVARRNTEIVARLTPPGPSRIAPKRVDPPRPSAPPSERPDPFLDALVRRIQK